MSGGVGRSMSGGMGTHPGSGVVLTVRAEPDAAEALLEEFFTGRGWSVAERGPGRVSYEIGSRRRTVFLGALAGSAFHLTAPLELREGPGVTEIRYLWGDSAGRGLGGLRGRARAARTHGETAAALERKLEADGRLVRVRTS